MKIKMSNFRNSMLGRFQSMDAFGEPVTHNYRGQNTHQTVPGALLTFLIKGFLLVYAT